MREVRCTDCMAVVRPVVALDIDGTLGAYHEHFLAFAEDYLGMAAGEEWYDGGERFRDWFCRVVGVSVDVFRDIKLAYRQGGMKRTMPAYKGAAELSRAIRQTMDAELWLTTTRPYLRLDNIDPDTREWLRRNGIEYDFMIYGRDKYAVLAERVGSHRVAAVLDDLGGQLDLAQSSFGKGVACQRATRYNVADRRAPRAHDLVAAGELIQQRVNNWRNPRWMDQQQSSSEPARARPTSGPRS